LFVLAIVPQLLLDIPTTWVLGGSGLAYELAGGSLWAPLTEEVAKGLGILLVLVLAHREIDSVLDGIVYGAMAGLGFAFTENVLYFTGALSEEGWGSWAFVVLLRTIPFGLNHALFAGLTGAGLAASYLSLNRLARLTLPGLGLIAGILFHSLHNLGASLAAVNCLTICFSFVFDWGGILLLGVLILLVWRQERGWMVEHLPGEVDEEVYHLVTSWRRWWRVRWTVLLRADLAAWRRMSALRQNTTEMAFKKQRLAQRGADARTWEEVERYRLRLSELGARPSLSQGARSPLLQAGAVESGDEKGEED